MLGLLPAPHQGYWRWNVTFLQKLDNIICFSHSVYILQQHFKNKWTKGPKRTVENQAFPDLKVSGSDKVGIFRSLQKCTLETEHQGGDTQPHAGGKGIWLIPVVPSFIPSQPGQLVEAAWITQTETTRAWLQEKPAAWGVSCWLQKKFTCFVPVSGENFIPETLSVSLARPSGLLVG